MFEVLEEMMKPSTDRKIQEAVEKNTEEVTKEVTKEVTGKTKVQDVEGIMKKFQTSLEDACEAIGWNVEQYFQVKNQINM